MKSTRSILVWLVALLVFLFSARYLWTTFQWREIRQVLCGANFARFMVGGVVTTLAYWALRAWRWKGLLSAIDASPVQWFPLYMTTACSLALALVTPFQSGEALKVEMLRRQVNLPRIEGYGSFVIERGLDLFVVVLLALIGAMVDPLPGLSPMVLAWFLAALIVGLFSAFGIMMALRGRKPVDQVLACVRPFAANPAALLEAALLTLLAWLVVALGWSYCLQSIGLELGFAKVISLTAGMTLVNVLSLIPGAVGVSEAGIAASLVHAGCAVALAQSGALAIRAYALVALALGLIHYVWLRRHTSDIKR